MHDTPRATGITRLIRAVHFSYDGLRAAYAHEEAVRIEIALVLIGIPLGLYFGDNTAEHLLLVGSLMLVLIVELMNTAIERTVDRISSERHDLSKQAKDAGSAAVFVAILLAAFIWSLILLT
jgi:diacylglycerol kinase (ATP)